jgi:hypothetical protein
MRIVMRVEVEYEDVTPEFTLVSFKPARKIAESHAVRRPSSRARAQGSRW